MRLIIETCFESGLSEAGMVTCNPAPLVIDIMASRDLSAPAVFLLAFAGYPLSFCTTLKRLTHTWITNEPSTLRLGIGVRSSVTAYYSLDKEERWARLDSNQRPASLRSPLLRGCDSSSSLSYSPLKPLFQLSHQRAAVLSVRRGRVARHFPILEVAGRPSQEL